MKAIRVRRRGTGKTGPVEHLLLDPGRTYCGRDPATLDVIEEINIEPELLSRLTGCGACRRSFEQLPRKVSEPLGDLRIVSAPRDGRTGHLNRGPTSTRYARRIR